MLTLNCFRKLFLVGILFCILGFPASAISETTTEKGSVAHIEEPSLILSQIPKESEDHPTEEFITSTTESLIIEDTTFVSSSSSLDSPCNETDQTQIYRDPNDCNKFYISCLASNSPTTGLAILVELKESYKTESRKCNDGFLFDSVKLKCLPSEKVDCITYQEFKCEGENNLFFSDSNEPSIFIECQNGTIPIRHKCQPPGTIFENATQTCVKPPIEPIVEETLPFSLALLQVFLKFVSSTRHILSPWMEVIKLNGTNSTKMLRNNNASLDADNETETMSESETRANFTLFWVNNYENDENDTNTTSADSEFYDEDEIEVFTQEKAYVVLYYSTITLIAFSFIISYLCIAGMMAKVFSRCEKEEEDFCEEFYRYNQNDKYLMTRM